MQLVGKIEVWILIVSQEDRMKLKTATLLAIIGTFVALSWSIISFLNLARGHIPTFYLLSIGPSFFFYVCLLIFFVTLHRNQ
jgi:hypothetical protein